MFERFTDRARRVVVLAQEEARMLGHNYIGTEHLLLGILHEGENAAAKALVSLGISLDAMRQAIEDIVGRGAQPRPSPGTSRSRRGPRRYSSFRCVSRCSSASTTSAPSTSCSPCSARATASPPRSWSAAGVDLNRARQQVIELLHVPREEDVPSSCRPPARLVRRSAAAGR